MNPKKLDRTLLAQLVDKYGYKEIAAELQRRDGWPHEGGGADGGVPVHDDYAACKITRKEDWLDLYVKPYFFGCEADDRMNAVAFTSSTRSAPGSTRSSAPISGISTCPT